MVLVLQSTTMDINMNVEAGLKIVNGLSWYLVEDGYLGIGKHCRKWIPFGHAKVVLPSQSVFLNRIGKRIFLNYF